MIMADFYLLMEFVDKKIQDMCNNDQNHCGSL